MKGIVAPPQNVGIISFSVTNLLATGFGPAYRVCRYLQYLPQQLTEIDWKLYSMCHKTVACSSAMKIPGGAGE